VRFDSGNLPPAIVCDAEKLSQIAIIQELGKSRIPVIATSPSEGAVGLASKYVSSKIVWPTPSHDPGFIDFMIEKLPRGVVFYSNDGSAENISRHKEELIRAGFALSISDASIMRRVLNKDELYVIGCGAGIRVPRTIRVCSLDDLLEKASEIGFPLIVKSTNLSGGVYRLADRFDVLPKIYREMQMEVGADVWKHRNAGLMVQEWIPQEHARLWNFNAFVRSGEIVSFSMGERVRTNVRPDHSIGSTLLYGVTAYDSNIHQLNQRLLASIGYDGIVETEWSTDSRNPAATYLYDFNPRPTGNIRWVFRSGVPLALQYYRSSLGLPLGPPSPMRTGTKYFKILYHDNDFLLSLDNPRFTVLRKARVLFENLWALLSFPRHAIDVLDVRDPLPTLRAVRSLPWLIAKRLARPFIPASHRAQTTRRSELPLPAQSGRLSGPSGES
jgi:predicted ATP-grasp superfamily ATP-dependent carboligase